MDISRGAQWPPHSKVHRTPSLVGSQEGTGPRDSRPPVLSLHHSTGTGWAIPPGLGGTQQGDTRAPCMRGSCGASGRSGACRSLSGTQNCRPAHEPGVPTPQPWQSLLPAARHVGLTCHSSGVTQATPSAPGWARSTPELPMEPCLAVQWSLSIDTYAPQPVLRGHQKRQLLEEESSDAKPSSTGGTPTHCPSSLTSCP